MTDINSGCIGMI